MRLDDALGEFNALRLGMTAGDDDVARLDRLAHAAFHAAAHLIVYGSLAPGAPNHARLATLGGTWERGWVEGDREQVGWGAELGYPALRWMPGRPRVTAYLLRSQALPERWSELDQFEGSAYCRILVPFYSVRGPRAVGYLYAIAPRPHPDENRHGPMAPADEEV
jgi:gamma-glutamylcyclotransferase (GGCT)/AIG2-like uncharacterized protein YtfP